MKFLIINGPNLNLLGKREPEIYGTTSMESYLDRLRCLMPDAEINLFQSNCEGAIIDCIQQNGFGEVDGIVINPGAYAHYSIAIADALRAVKVPVAEVHISNVHSREDFRHRMVTAAAAKCVIAGCGLDGYELAIRHLAALNKA